MARRLRTSWRLGCFSLTVQPMAPHQLSMPNVADPDVIPGSFSCFLSCLSANGPTARPFGTTLQALDLSGLHSVTRVSSASTPSSCLPFHPSDQWPRPSCFRRPIATGIP